MARSTVRGGEDVATLDRRKLTTRRSAPAPRRRAPRRQAARAPAARGDLSRAHIPERRGAMLRVQSSGR